MLEAVLDFMVAIGDGYRRDQQRQVNDIASRILENLPRPAEDAFTMARAFSRALSP